MSRPERIASNRFVDLLAERTADGIIADLSLLDRAREVLDHDDRCQSRYSDVWRHLLDGGPLAVVAVLTSTHPGTTPLKTDFPFFLIGELIDEDERLRLVERTYSPVRLWLLKPVEGLPEDEDQNPWEEWWERVHGMVVRATSEEEAGRVAHEATRWAVRPAATGRQALR